jgi:hypothetical protein
VTHQIRPGPAGPDPLAQAAWRKATASDANSGCVEIAFFADGGVGVRDSKDPSKISLAFTAHEWACFLNGAKSGEFDLPS